MIELIGTLLLMLGFVSLLFAFLGLLEKLIEPLVRLWSKIRHIFN